MNCTCCGKGTARSIQYQSYLGFWVDILCPRCYVWATKIMLEALGVA